MSNHDSHDNNTPHAHPGYGTFLAVWGGLLVLTAVTVGVAQFDFGFLNVVVAMAIATTKALLVIIYFMHLKYENNTLRLMVFTTFVILAIFIGFTFFDTAYRY